MHGAQAGEQSPPSPEKHSLGLVSQVSVGSVQRDGRLIVPSHTHGVATAHTLGKACVCSLVHYITRA